MYIVYDTYNAHRTLYISSGNEKDIDIDDTTLTKLKLISAFEDLSVKALMEKAVRFFVEHKEKERYESLTDDEKEDIGLLALMSQADMNDLGPVNTKPKIGFFALFPYFVVSFCQRSPLCFTKTA